MRILMTGASGLIGSALIPALTSQGRQVTRLLRSTGSGDTTKTSAAEAVAYWDPAAGHIETGSLEGFDAVVHLAGENIASGRWTAPRKARIRDSRIRGTRLLSEALAQLARKPAVFLCASAIGYYGDRGDETLKESSPPGSGFLPELCSAWEAASEPAARGGIRVVNVRIGIVLSRAGGALAKMLPPFRLGAGGRIGDGRQVMSWIAIDDLVSVFRHGLETGSLAGPVNAVAPHPVSNAEFTRTLGRALRRPTVFPVPAFLARLAFGEMADALLLASARVEPAKLQATGFKFRFTELEPALRHILGKE